MRIRLLSKWFLELEEDLLLENNFNKSEAHVKKATSVKDIAEMLPVSESWVYKNLDKLGGVKIGGAVFLPSKEEVYERLFQQKEEVVRVPVSIQKEKIHRSGIRKKERCSCSGVRKKKRSKATNNTSRTGENRHGLSIIA